MFKSATVLLLIFACAAQGAGFAFAADRSDAVSYLIKFKDGQSAGILANLGFDITRRFGFSDASEFSGIYTFSSTLSLNDLRSDLRGEYEYLQEQGQAKAADLTASVIPNDPGFTVNPLDIDKQWGLIKTGFDKAWEKTTGSKDVVVAVIDTGIDATHEDLQKINFVKGYNLLTRQEINGNTNSDDNGHGTLIAGVLGATVNNGVGVAGTNWDISIMPLKALDAQGKGEAAAVSEAIVWAADHGASIINLSLGGIGFGHDTVLANAISYAFNKGVIIVSAAGNDVAAVGKSLDIEPVYPICDDNNSNMIIGVAATDQNDLKASFSNFGKNCIDVSAPGKRILSTINYDPLTKHPAPNSYAYASGTSLAVPFVAGQAALLKSLYPLATNTQIRDRIISTADPIDNLNLSQCEGNSCRGMLGSGRINVEKSLQSIIVAPDIHEGDLVKAEDTGAYFRILGGQKRMVSPFVFNQKFLGASFKISNSAALNVFPEGPYEMPLDGTLVKLDSNPTVYYTANGMKFPVTYQVFVQRGLNFKDVNTVSFPEFNSWTTGNLLSPAEGTLVKTARNKTVYWVVDGSLHPITYNFYVERGLNIFPIMVMPDNDIASFSKGEAYIR